MNNQEFAQAVRKLILRAHKASGYQPLHIFLTPDSLARLKAEKENQLANIRDPEPISLMGWPFTVRDNLPDAVVVVPERDLQFPDLSQLPPL